MIKLKNISKFYYGKGVVASGISKVNLEFKIGEFVAITGESGSGKSTLLNVISGLDSYEDGEMYINGNETSHYTEKDFEEYRRKYVGNIFQNFNLINSYTVYQNIELVLLLNGSRKNDIKQKVNDLIKQVNLYKFRNTRVSKLSGGQKQRVAIARALAKETPIIIADEPTGNLDSKSAKEIIRILKEISLSKLVIVVTHNYDEIKEAATRKIKMHDGKVLEDKKFTQTSLEENNQEVKYKNITFFNKIRLGIRNTFNIIPKFILLFFVFFFVTIAVISSYSSFKEQEYLSSKTGRNVYFQNIDDSRIVVKKKDKTLINEEDYKKIEEIDNVKSIVKSDVFLDKLINMSDDNSLWLYGFAYNIESLEGKLDLGRMPEEANEIVLVGRKDDYYIGTQGEEILGKQIFLQDIYTGETLKDTTIKIVGIKYDEDVFYYTNFYMDQEILNKLLFQTNQEYSEVKILFNDTYTKSDLYTNDFKIYPNANVESGKVIISSDQNYNCKNSSCINQALKIEVENLYYQTSLDLIVSKTYNKNNIKKLVGITDYEIYNGGIFINQNDYKNLFNKENYQSSIFVSDVEEIDNTVKQIENLGFETLKIKDTLVQSGDAQIFKILRTIITSLLVITLFFISYFVIKLILKSRNVYYSTIRILGANKTTATSLLVIELLVVSNIAFIAFLSLILLQYFDLINIGFINTALTYLSIYDYIILYFILIAMSYLISRKYSKKLFKDTAINTLKEEV